MSGLFVIGVLIYLIAAFTTRAADAGGNKKPLAQEPKQSHVGGGRGGRAPRKQAGEVKNGLMGPTANSNKNRLEKGSGIHGGGGGSYADSLLTEASLTAVDEPNLTRPLREGLQTIQLGPSQSLRGIILSSEDSNRPASEMLSELVQENNPFRARELILTILLRKEEALPALEEALQSGSDAAKWTVLSLICKNLRWPEMSDQVLQILKDPNTPDKVLARAVAAAAALSIKAGAETIRMLLAESKNDDVREVTIRALGELRHADVKSDLKNALMDPSPRIAIAAAESLAKMGDPNGYSVAAKYLDHADWFIRTLAVRAMGHIGTDEALDRLTLHLAIERSPTAKAEIEIALNRISLAPMTRAQRVARLQQLLDSENRFVSRWAHKQVLKEFPDECIPIFQERSTKASGRLRRAAEIYLLLAEELTKGGFNGE
jgi:hypothetical protein